jgi:hypothetical protein
MSIEIFKPNENPFGISYEDHVKKFWKFTCSFPKNKNPARRANNGQIDEIANQNSDSPVFYLNICCDGEESLVERTCNVPRGKGIFIPVMSVEVSEKEVQDPSIDKLKKLAKEDQNSVKGLSVKLDGIEVNDIHSYRTPTNVFELDFPQDALFDVSAGTCQTVADGFYIITRPPPPGTHIIEYKGNLENNKEENIDNKYSVNIKYTLEIQ